MCDSFYVWSPSEADLIADRFHDPGHVNDTRTDFEVDLVVPIRLAETVCMTVAGEYRRNALQCWQRASESICIADKATWLKLAQEWQRLAERVDPGTALSYNYGAGAKNFHSNRSLPIIEPVSRLSVRILKFTEQRPASEKRR